MARRLSAAAPIEIGGIEGSRSSHDYYGSLLLGVVVQNFPYLGSPGCRSCLNSRRTTTGKRHTLRESTSPVLRASGSDAIGRYSLFGDRTLRTGRKRISFGAVAAKPQGDMSWPEVFPLNRGQSVTRS